VRNQIARRDGRSVANASGCANWFARRRIEEERYRGEADGESSQTAGRWLAICLAQDGTLKPYRLEAVPALYEVDGFRWVACEYGNGACEYGNGAREQQENSVSFSDGW
jgi:hypothetical protein